MIRAFYGLTENPFDARELQLLPQQQEIHDTLRVHCQQGGLCLVLGVPGTGKSVLKQSLLRLPEKQHLVATVGRTLHTYTNTVKILCQAFKIEFDHSAFQCERRLIEQAFSLNRAGLGHNTFTPAAVELIVRSADGILRQARNLAVGCLIEAVRSGTRTIDIDNVNRVLLQPHWQKETDLVDY